MRRPTVTREPLPPTETIELLRRARGGDGAAVNELFTRYAPRVRGLAAVRMGRSLVDLVDCDDIVQEALMTALDHIERFEPRSEGSLIAWLATIVHSRIENARRAALTEKRGSGAVVRRSDLGTTTLSQLPAAAPGPSPSQHLMAREFDDDIERALLGLGETERQIVYCRLVLDMEYADIAASLQLANADSARALFSKGIGKLRQRMDGGG